MVCAATGCTRLLAATAIEHNLILITRNVKYFISFPVTTIDPWSGP